MKKIARAVVRKWPGLERSLVIFHRRFIARFLGYPRFKKLELSVNRANQRSGNKRILVATSLGSHLPAVQMETCLSIALSDRGCDVDILLCDGALPACQMCEPRIFPDQNKFAKVGPSQELCKFCFEPAIARLEKIGLNIKTYSSLIYMLPKYGIIGAAYASLVGCTIQLAFVVYFSRRFVAFRFPVETAARVVAAALFSFAICRHYFWVQSAVHVSSLVS